MLSNKIFVVEKVVDSSNLILKESNEEINQIINKDLEFEFFVNFNYKILNKNSPNFPIFLVHS